MANLFQKLMLANYPEQNIEDRFQARVLILVHIALILLLAIVLSFDYSEYNMKKMIVGIMLVSLGSILFLRLGYLTTVTIISYATIGLFATLLIFSRSIYNNYEVYMLSTIQLFIMVVSSLLTNQRRYTIFTTGMAIVYILMLLFFRGIPLSTPGNMLEIDDYIIAASLLLMSGFIIISTTARRKFLLETAKIESAKSQEKAIALKESLDEKNLLLHEVHHRVKNNLGVAMSLLNLQIRSLDPESEAVAPLNESIARLESMALVHERLYSSGNIKSVEFKPYISAISDAILRSFHKPNISFRINVEDDLSMDITQAVPCGLILNELITNICKHAFPDDQQGIAEISFSISVGNIVTLVVSDHGVGIPDSEWPAKDSLGVHLINLLTEQLDGTLLMDGDGGTTVTISFPLTQSSD